MDKLKSYDDLLAWDSRSPLRIQVNRETGEERPYGLAQHYERIATARLRGQAPPSVRRGFVAAQHAGVYSWFWYPLVQTAMLQALSSLELAMRMRKPEVDVRGLARWFEVAIADKWLDTQLLYLELKACGVVARPDVDAPAGFLVDMCDLIKDLRNDLAHGSDQILPDCTWVLLVVAAFIDQLHP